VGLREDIGGCQVEQEAGEKAEVGGEDAVRDREEGGQGGAGEGGQGVEGEEGAAARRALP